MFVVCDCVGGDQSCSNSLYSSDPLSSGLHSKGCRLWSEMNIPKYLVICSILISALSYNPFDVKGL